MLRAGLTGGLGSGKTTVAAMFRSLGAHIIDADALGRELMFPGRAVYSAIIDHFGPEVVSADGVLNRSLLADLAFRQNRLAELNSIVHPPVIAAQQQWAERIFARDPHAIAIVESALIFEADRQGSAPGWRHRFDRIILVTAPASSASLAMSTAWRRPPTQSRAPSSKPMRAAAWPHRFPTAKKFRSSIM